MPKTVHLTEDISLSTRRTFCAHACRAVTGLAAGAVVASCGGSQSGPSSVSAPAAPSVTATVSGRVVSIALDSATALGSVGAGAQVRTSLGLFLVARTGQDSYSAMTALCTHERCDVTGFSGGRFICPCHGSTFTTSGAVVTGPAPRALQTFPTQVNGGVLSFSV